MKKFSEYLGEASLIDMVAKKLGTKVFKQYGDEYVMDIIIQATEDNPKGKADKLAKMVMNQLKESLDEAKFKVGDKVIFNDKKGPTVVSSGSSSINKKSGVITKLYAGDLAKVKFDGRTKNSTVNISSLTLQEEVSTTSISGSDALAPIAPTGKAFGMDYFEVDCDKFENCRKSPKKKYKHWQKLLGMKEIQQYAKQNKNPFLIKRQGSQDYLRAR